MLKVPAVFSQRDPRWSEILLGYNISKPYTIGLFGCLITCFSMYIGKQPNEVNDTLKTNGGFTPNGGDFYWGKSTVLGLRQGYISERFENGPASNATVDQAKKFLDANLPLVAEIDFNPNTDGEEMHFVLIIGYSGDSFFAADPWTGQIINLDVYGGFKRALIQYRAYDKKLEPEIPTPINTEQMIPYSQVIIDSYLGMTGEFPTDDEKLYRAREHLALAKLIESLSGDKRFFVKYILPIQNQQIEDLTRTNHMQSEHIAELNIKIEQLEKEIGTPQETPNLPPNPPSDIPVDPIPQPPETQPGQEMVPVPTRLIAWLVAFLNRFLPKNQQQ